MYGLTFGKLTFSHKVLKFNCKLRPGPKS